MQVRHYTEDYKIFSQHIFTMTKHQNHFLTETNETGIILEWKSANDYVRHWTLLIKL